MEHGEIDPAFETLRNKKKIGQAMYKEGGETDLPFLERFDNVTDVLLLNVSANTKIHL